MICQTKLFTLSEVPVCEVFSDAKLGSEVTDEMRSIMDDLVSHSNLLLCDYD